MPSEESSFCSRRPCFAVSIQCLLIWALLSSLAFLYSCSWIFVRPIPEEGEPELPKTAFGYYGREAGMLEPPDYSYGGLNCVYYGKDDKATYFDSTSWHVGEVLLHGSCGIGLLLTEFSIRKKSQCDLFS